MNATRTRTDCHHRGACRDRVRLATQRLGGAAIFAAIACASAALSPAVQAMTIGAGVKPKAERVVPLPIARERPTLDLADGRISAVDPHAGTIVINGQILLVDRSRVHIFDESGVRAGMDRLRVGERVRFAMSPAPAQAQAQAGHPEERGAADAASPSTDAGRVVLIYLQRGSP